MNRSFPQPIHARAFLMVARVILFQCSVNFAAAPAAKRQRRHRALPLPPFYFALIVTVAVLLALFVSPA
jgi:hypothetical protein